MNILKKLILSIMLVAAPLAVAGNGIVSAGPFEASKRDVCRGANLSSNSSCRSGAAENKLSDTIQFVVDLLTFIVGIAAVITIIISGIKLIASSGDPGAVTSAKNGIIYAVIGLIVAALAQVLVRFIINNIYG